MNTFIKLLLVIAALSSCSTSEKIPWEDVEIVSVSAQLDMTHIYFKTPEGVDCAGVHIEQNGEERNITFLRSGSSSKLSIDAVAAPWEGPLWEGSLRVSVPHPEGLSQMGGRLVLTYDGCDDFRNIMTFDPAENPTQISTD